MARQKISDCDHYWFFDHPVHIYRGKHAFGRISPGLYKIKNVENKERTMPKIILIGANHKTAPVELREKLSFSIEVWKSSVNGLVNIKVNNIYKVC